MKRKKFHCKSEAQKKAIRRNYAIRAKKKRVNSLSTRQTDESRERYFNVMRQDFPKDFIDDDFLDAIEDFARH